jgi:mono/diheme cytochrome c family protein
MDAMSDRNWLVDWTFRGITATAVVVGSLAAAPSAEAQQAAAPAGAPTFARDIAPILQRSCQNCHTAEGSGPMSLVTYEEVRPWARSIKRRTAMGPRAGVMPPWFVEKDIGIQKFKGDPSLSEQEIAKIAAWADAGAPLGNIADMPPAKAKAGEGWTIGEPDLVLRSKEMVVPASGPDWWGDVGHIPTGLTEDRYVSAVEVREINDIPRSGPTSTVGGRYVFHHMNYESVVAGGSDEANTAWPIHEVGRNPDIFPPEAGRLLAAGSELALSAGHIHSNGRETKAQLEFGFKFFPKGYKPLYKRSPLRLGNGIDLDVKSNQAKQEIHSYGVLQEHTKIIAFEPHLHAPGVRMCIEAVWGHNILTLNCVGYDHNWVKQYVYDDDAAPLLPKGTIVHLIGFLDTTPANTNVADARNWAGGGRRSVSNMFIDLGYSVSLTEEQFQAEMAKRRAKMKNRNDYDIGCPLCWATPPPTSTAAPAAGRQQQ